MFHLSHKIELKPNKKQTQYFMQACGVARFTYNWGLNEWKKQYENGEKPSYVKLSKQLNSIKKEEFPWITDVLKNACQCSLADLENAYKRFFKKQSKHPKFKKKGVHDSFRADNGPRGKHGHAVQTIGKKVKLPKIGWVKMKEEVRFSGRILSAVVSRKANRWFMSLTIEVPWKIPARVKTKPIVGVDLGVKTLATLDDGAEFSGPKALRKKLNKLKRLSKDHSRKKKGSNNRKKSAIRLAKLHYKISNIRKDSLHKLSHFLVNNYDVVCLEDLNVSGMVKNRKLSRAISDMGFYELRRQLEYKSHMYGSEVKYVDRWFPSSKTCSACGLINDDLKLADRSWVCECGVRHDRDVNAAINIKLNAVSSTVSACGASSSGLSDGLKLGATKQETLERK